MSFFAVIEVARKEQINSINKCYLLAPNLEVLGYKDTKVSEVRVRLGITLGYARAPKVRDISSKYYPPPP